MVIRQLTLLLVFCTTFSILGLSAFANDARYGRGFAVYARNKNLGTGYHAGIMIEDSISQSNSVVCAGLFKLKKATETSFVGSYRFLGYYRGKSMSQQNRNNVETTARALIGAEVRVCNNHQIQYDPTVCNIGARVSPSNVDKLSQDGIIEYCYEYNNIRMRGGDGTWNISVNSSSNRSAHANINIADQFTNYTECCYGDLDGNGVSNSADARTALRIASRVETIVNDYQEWAGDVDGQASDTDHEQRITSADARYILQYASGQIDRYPADPREL